MRLLQVKLVIVLDTRLNWHNTDFLKPQFQVRSNHHLRKLRELNLRLPVQNLLCLSAVTEQSRNFCRSLVAIIGLKEVLIIQTDKTKALLKKLANSVRLLCCNDKVIRL